MFKIIEKAPPQWLLDNIANGNDKLKVNYTLKKLKLPEMICFCTLMYNDDIVGFSGLQKWKDGTARVRYPWKYLAPYQIKVAEDLGYTKLFWSTELYRRPGKTMALTIEHATQYLPVGWRYHQLDGYYDVNGVQQEVCEILKS